MKSKITNHLGNTVALVPSDASRDLMTWLYFPFGKQVTLAEGFADRVTEAFTTKELDKGGDLDLYYFGARYYDADFASWTQVDPMRQFSSPFLYVGNGFNPLISVDPDGNQTGFEFFGQMFAQLFGYSSVPQANAEVAAEHRKIKDAIEPDAISADFSLSATYGAGAEFTYQKVNFLNTNETGDYLTISGTAGMDVGAGGGVSLHWYTGDSKDATGDNFSGVSGGIDLFFLSIGRSKVDDKGNYWFSVSFGLNKGINSKTLPNKSIGKYKMGNTWRLD